MNELVREYKSWLKDNQNFILHLRSHNSSLYTRVQPVYEVLNYLVDEWKELNDYSEDLLKIFQVGLEYLHTQVYTCKLYLEKTFNNDFHEFLHYDQVIGYLLFIEDLRYELSEHNIDSDNKKIDKLISYLEELMANRAVLPENLNIYVDSEIHKVYDTSKEFQSIIDIFVEIAETLGIDLYYETEYVVGKDI
jgi:hypothetical protein